MNYFKLKKKRKITKVEISFLFGLIAAIMASFFGCLNNTEKIEKNVLRLHILANSNSKKDQNLKLKVREKNRRNIEMFLCCSIKKYF